MLASTHASCLVGLDAHAVLVEVHLGRGLPGFDLVGLPEAAVRESRVRVKSALATSGFELPPRHVVLNLAPADLRKRGASFDLAIAVALLTASGVSAPTLLEDTLFVGELSLSGEVRAVRGLLPQLAGARERGLTRAVVPAGNAAEARLAEGLEVRLATRLSEVVEHLSGSTTLPGAGAPLEDDDGVAPLDDLADVRGQASGRRALEIAAAGEHPLLFVGPPGAGKTMLARRLPGLLPPPTPREARSFATIASAAGLAPTLRRPFRAPHHTVSTAALIGGGDPVRPGEVTLAHGGVLFLDELPELSRPSLESLRTVLESGVAVVARAKERVEMPAAPLLVAAMNPCPCGLAGDPRGRCACTPGRILAYRARVSGPILERFDVQVSLPPVELADVVRGARGEPSAGVRARVAAARAFRQARGGGPRPGLDALLAEAAPHALELLERAGARFGLSMRGHVRALRVARTVADLAGEARIEPAHVQEALALRLADAEATRAGAHPGAAGGGAPQGGARA